MDAIKSWNQNIDELTTFFNFPKELRKLIYTTNSIDGFCTINSLKKMLYFWIINQSIKALRNKNSKLGHYL